MTDLEVPPPLTFYYSKGRDQAYLRRQMLQALQHPNEKVLQWQSYALILLRCSPPPQSMNNASVARSLIFLGKSSLTVITPYRR